MNTRQISGHANPRRAGVALLAAFVLAGFSIVQAAQISPISDTISDSAPSLLANHTISFTTTSAIPVSGRIIITPEDGDFTIPMAMNHEDVDFSVGGADRDLDALPGAGAGAPDGVSIISGTSGSITITLNDTDGIPGGSEIVIEIGTQATHQVVGEEQIVNPAIAGQSYIVSVRTEDAMATTIDSARTHIMILDPVEIGAEVQPPAPPVRSNGLPDMDLPSGTTTVVMSLDTNIIANCRYDTVAGTDFDDMPFIFSVLPVTEHETTLTGLTDNTTYTFYIRCDHPVGGENPDDFIITFSILDPGSGSGSGSGGGSGGGTGGGSSTGNAGGSGTGGPGSSGSSGKPFPFVEDPAVFMNGWAPREAGVRILKDGQVLAESTASITGEFSLAVEELTDGVHSIGVVATDLDGQTNRTIPFTFSVESGTTTVISDVLLPPTLNLSATTIDPGGTLSISGMSVPNLPVEVWISVAGKRNAEIRQEVTTNAEGRWSLALNPDLPVGAYDVRARAFHPQVGWGEFSARSPLGVGQDGPIDTCARSDINDDTRVNLIDFSILLFHWTTNFPDADINLDGIVNLTDFSIQLFCWTG